MSRKFTGDDLILATHNPGKIKEISAFLAPFVSTFKTAAEMNIPEPEETGVTFAENAEIKARAVAMASGLPALADDSGLCVDALDGAPGIYSARYAGPDRDWSLARKRLANELGDKPRHAHFACAMALAWPDGHCESVEGRVDGLIVWPERGEGGFGYDPIFQPIGHDLTFGEDQETKKAISHRFRAFDALIHKCFL
ncbi:MAG: non-canonical purine NTP pyrophosphatase, RdgB/HAM1 family [Alphaproteobacteria bacterium GWF2_58_20]|nr:MAG: non-canonical purine NTP pyrophosphatase, RdgB/HAM1 family [Alphaproteobacteria bacterium GWF2_58_20]